MANVPKDLSYTDQHEYVKSAGDKIVAVGITDYAQGELGDIVYLELPKVGAKFKKGDVFGTIEAVKAVSELYAPVSGEIVDINGKLEREPQLVNSAPYADGWMVKFKLSDPGETKGLMDAAAYSAHIGQ